jgi:hypothetical protein
MTPQVVGITRNHFLPQKSAACDTGGPRKTVTIVMAWESQTVSVEPPTAAATSRANYADNVVSKENLEKVLE